MRKTLIALAAAAGLGVFAGAASADPGGYVPPQPGAGGGGGGFTQMGGPGTLLGAGDAAGRAPDRYGWNPAFKRFFRLGNGGCNGCGSAGAGYGQGGPAYNPNAAAPMQGTLVFPNHTFVRSPRDYFMMDLNK
ncbi:hypothetical protein [Gemmata sp.]|uniref:hypothetical protein n=1 Tax=Gemmata sp. TaxID=1914242 RepID=UPI003F6EC821